MEEERMVRCGWCGSYIGMLKGSLFESRHKGRTVRVKVLTGKSEIEVVCDRKECGGVNTIVLGGREKA